MRNSKAYKAMVEKAEAYEKALSEYRAGHDGIINTYGCGSDELKAFYDTHDKPEYPLTSGQGKALHLVYWNKGDELEMSDHVWDSEVHDFIETLREFGAKTFVVTCKSTALMENMHRYAREGCKLIGLCEIVRTNHWGETETVMGVRFGIQ